MPALTAQGVTDKEGIAEHIGRFLTNQYAAQLGVIFATQQARIEKDLNIEKGSKGLAAAKTFTEDDVKVAGMGLWNAIKSDVARFVPTNVLAKAEHDAAQILLTPGPTTVGSAADLSRQLLANWAGRTFSNRSISAVQRRATNGTRKCAPRPRYGALAIVLAIWKTNWRGSIRGDWRSLPRSSGGNRIGRAGRVSWRYRLRRPPPRNR